MGLWVRWNLGHLLGLGPPVDVEDHLLGQVAEVHEHVAGHQVGHRRLHAGHLVEAEKPDDAAHDHGVGDDVVREGGDPLRLVQAELNAEVRPVHTQGDSRAGADSVSDSDHCQRHRVVLEVGEVIVAQLNQSEGLVEYDVTLKESKRHIRLLSVRSNVHAVVHVAGHHQERIRMHVTAGHGSDRHVQQVVVAHVVLGHEHKLRHNQNHVGHALPEQSRGLDGCQEQIPRRDIIRRGQKGQQLANRLQALGVDDVVQLQRNPRLDIHSVLVVLDVMDLTVEVETHDVTVGEGVSHRGFGEDSRDALVLVHSHDATVRATEREKVPGTIHVLHVEYGVAVVAVLLAGDVDLVHPLDHFACPKVGGELAVEHIHHGLRGGDIREGLLGLLRKSGEPPVSGVVLARLLVQHPLAHESEVLPTLGLGDPRVHHVVARDQPVQEGGIHVRNRVEHARHQIIGVLQEHAHPGAVLHIRALVCGLSGDPVRHILPHVCCHHQGQ
mmetsp:Transcript_14453/g.30917  ORF Transcript_14453/g.30917 Transcript_14453/m.30917 type:complete len:496 (+) Transcript_14453:531-2018(+)